jgi:DNA-directed RNA polymerase specialized sigma24 family protein
MGFFTLNIISIYIYLKGKVRMIANYIEKNYKEILQKVRAVTRNHQDTEDLLQDCILNLLEKGSDYTNKIVEDDKVQHYIIKMVHIQYNSSTSPFYTQYKKTLLKSVEINDDILEGIEDIVETHQDTETLAKEVKLYIGNLPVYERTIAEKHFLTGDSQREMSRYYNINRIHITKDINNIKKNIRMSFNKDNYKTK